MVNSSLAVNPYLRKTMPYQVKDLAMITQLVILQQAIVAQNRRAVQQSGRADRLSRRRIPAS
jgi:tripartite-type tricarboxylate transporter receptor subunit TctC